MCQPTTTPAINSADMVHQVAEDWPKKAVVDFTIQAMAEPGNINEIPGMLEAGAVSMEFLGQGSTGPMMMDIMRAVHEDGGISSMSASDGGHSQFMRQHLQDSGRVEIRDWLGAWPRENESVGVARVLLLTENTPYRFHFHMITTRRSLELIREAKEKRPGSFTVETSPKYLLLTEEDHVRMGAFGTVLPRFKTPDDNAAVWSGLLDGAIDMVATDHAPHARAEKEEGFRDIWKAPTGVPEVEISLPLMLTQVNEGRLSLSQLVTVMSENPAREYGIYPQKGTLQVGSDADLVLVDLERESTIDDGALVTAPKYSAFGGTQVRGTPVMTMVRGNVVMDEGASAEGPAIGQLVKPRR
jgi:dihydroorotase (multifunctional complex type)